MFLSSKIIGIVPSRSGSKGIPDKNIKDFAGKPLMAWAIESGKKSGVLDRVILLTDSEKYADIGKKYGAEVPWIQPAEYASDSSHVFHALKWLVSKLIEEGERPDYIALLEPTAPARRPEHIKQLVELVVQNKADSGITVIPVPTGLNAYWQMEVQKNGQAKLVIGNESVSKIIRRRQQLPSLYTRGGSTYVSKIDCLLKDDPDMYGEDTRAIIIDPSFSLDLDTEEDWKNAEEYVRSLDKNE